MTDDHVDTHLHPQFTDVLTDDNAKRYKAGHSWLADQWRHTPGEKKVRLYGRRLRVIGVGSFILVYVVTWAGTGETAPLKQYEVVSKIVKPKRKQFTSFRGRGVIRGTVVEKTPDPGVEWFGVEGNGIGLLTNPEGPVGLLLTGLGDGVKELAADHSLDQNKLDPPILDGEGFRFDLRPAAGYWMPGVNVLTVAVSAGEANFQAKRRFLCEWTINCAELDKTNLVSLTDPARVSPGVSFDPEDARVVLAGQRSRAATIKTAPAITEDRPLSVGIEISLKEIEKGAFQLVLPNGIGILLGDGEANSLVVKSGNSYIGKGGGLVPKRRDALACKFEIPKSSFWLWASFDGRDLIVSTESGGGMIHLRTRCPVPPKYRDKAAIFRSYGAEARIREIRVASFLATLNGS